MLTSLKVKFLGEEINCLFAFLILVWPTAPAAILGVWGGLILNWSVQHIPRLNTG